MTLKVGGSNPFVYPISKINTFDQIWQLTPLSFTPKSSNKNLQFYNLLGLVVEVSKAWAAPLLHTQLKYIYVRRLLSSLKNIPSTKRVDISFIRQNFKLKGYGHNLEVNHKKALPAIVPSKGSSTKQFSLIKVFQTFVSINIGSQTKIFKPHHSFYMFYLGQSKGGIKVISVAKLFSKWKLVYHLCFNIYFYKINMLIFSPSFFKNESLSLNWNVLGKFPSTWRYIKPFLVYKLNRITDSGEFIFRKLKFIGFNIGCVTDVLYHSKTVYYLKRLNFYTFGLVPTLYNSKTLDFAVPTTNDNLLTQLFFIRFLIIVKQKSLTYKSDQLQTCWVC